MSPQIIFINPTAKPPLAAPAAPTPHPQRRSLSWGITGRLHLPSAERPQPQTDDRPSRRLSREGRTLGAKLSHEPEAPKVRMRYVDRGSRLERLREPRILSEVLDRQRTARPELEYLSILHSQRTHQYWIGNAETGEVFLRQAFTTLEHCYEAAAEIERTFELGGVLELEPDLLTAVEAIARACVWREQAELRIAVA